jgi:UDP-glucose 4-epimerase
MNILVLGGDGFIGSHLVDEVVTLGHDVTVFDRFPDQNSRNLEHLRKKIKTVSGEFANRDDLLKAIKGQDVIYHFICATTPAVSWIDPFIDIHQNLNTSVQLMELAVRQKVKKIVFASSGGTIYGSQSNIVDENTTPRPISPYGITKLAVEHFLNYFHVRYGIEVDIYRIGNPYGERQQLFRPQGVISVWMRNILNRMEIQVYGDNTTVRDYIYIKDVSYLLTNSVKDLNSSEVFNLGSGQATSITQLLEIFKNCINEPIHYKVFPKRSFDYSSIVLDNTKLMKLFPDIELQKLENKITDIWNYYKYQNFNGE